MNSPLLSTMNFIRTFLFAAALTLLTVALPVWAQTAGSLDTNFIANITSANGYVNATVVQPDGMVIIGGSFSIQGGGGAVHTNIARLEGNGTVDDSFAASANDTVNSIAVQADGKILLGGAFTSVNGSAVNAKTGVNRIARLDGQGKRDPAFNASGGVGLGGANNEVKSVAVQADGKILLGGNFTSLNGSVVSPTTGVNRIARLDRDGGRDPAFNANGGVGLGGANNYVNSVAVQADGKILLGGMFTSVNGSAVTQITRLDSEGRLDADFKTTGGVGGGWINSVALQADGGILLGGIFTLANGNTACIARLDGEGRLDANFNAGSKANDYASSVAVQADGKILLGGAFFSLNGSAVSATTGVNRFARLNRDGSRDTAFNSSGGVGLGGANGNVSSVAVQADGKILPGGIFRAVNGTGRIALARLNNDGATQTLNVQDATQVRWSRSGAAPEISQVTFEQSTDGGGAWTLLGPGTHIGTTWQLTGLSLPAYGQVRARGRTAGGSGSGSSSLVQQVARLGALGKLEEGNRRYADGGLTHPNQSVERRKEVAQGQHPFAIIVGCSDSRVPPEIVFDQGLGDLFVIRIAGQVVDDSALGSIEYAVEHLHVGLIVVLGHERCGAVDAAVDAVVNGTEYHEHIKTLVDAIKPAVEHVKDKPGDILENSVKENATQVAHKLKEAEPVIKEEVEHGKVNIVSGYYDLETGVVTIYE